MPILNGPELEQWFKDFARKTGILVERPFEMESTIRLFNEKLNQKLNRARVFIHKDFDNGEDWIDRTIHRRSIPNLNSEVKTEFINRLADLVIGTDAVVQVKNTKGTNVKIAVDVTSNDEQADSKLKKVRGYSVSNQVSKANKNIPVVREELGISKHLILVLNNSTDQLPNAEKLLDVIYSLAESKSATRLADLKHLDERDRFNWRESEAADPSKMWQKYSRGINSKATNVIALEASKRALRDNHSPQAVLKMLTQDPQYRQFLRRDRGDCKAAETYANAILNSANIELSSQHEQPTSNKSKEIDGPQL